jgi:hypothetical protein
MVKKDDLNVGMVFILPDGFKLAPADCVPEELKEKVGKSLPTPPTIQSRQKKLL